MKPLIYTFTLFIFSVQLIAQLGDRFYDPGVFQIMQPSGDGNYFATGSKNNNKIWLVKMSPDNAIIWEKTFSGPSGEAGYANYLLVNPDGSLLIAGTLKPAMYDLRSFVIKVDHNGNLIWNKTYNTASSVFHICPKPIGGYYLSCFYDNTGSTDSGVVLEIDANGNVIYSFKVDVYNQTRVKYIDIANDGNLIVIGRTNVIGAGFQGIFISKRNKNGTELNRSVYDTGYREDDYDNNNYSYPLGVGKLSNGNYVIVNSYHERDCILLEIDQNLNAKSNKIYGDGTHNELPYGLQLFSNGDVLISGETQTYINGQYKHDVFAIRLNSDGYELWRKYYNHGIDNAAIFGAVELDNHDLFFYGFAKNNQAWILRTDQLGENSNMSITGKVIYDKNANCVVDAGDLPLKSVLVKNQNGVQEYAASDINGNFNFHTLNITNELVAFPPDDFSELCVSQKQVRIDTNLNTAFVEFLIKPMDNCTHLRVQITQPDLVKCQSSKYKVYVKNLGNIPSQQQQLKIHLDPMFTLKQYSPGGQINQNNILYNLPALQSNEEREYEFTVELSCDAFLGASHLVTADILPEVCGQEWNGAKVEIITECSGSQAKFNIQNIGKINMPESAVYKVYADQYLIDEQIFQLNMNQFLDLEYDANGKTFQIEIVDENLILQPDEYVYAYLEACGRNKNGIFSTTFENAFRTYNPGGHHSFSLTGNSTGIPDRVQEMIGGLGSYHFITKSGWMEYTLRTRNSLNQQVNQVELQLSLTSNLDLGSFQVLGNSENVLLIPIDSQNLKVIIDNVQLEPNASGANADLFFKFKVKSFDNTPADSSQRSFFSIAANAYFEKMGPYPLRISRNNLTQTLPYVQKPEEKYDNNISLFGGKYYDFGTNVAAAMDGSVFILIQTSSYNDGKGNQSLVVKLDKDSKVIWYSIIPNKNNYSVYQEKIVALEDGGCMVLATGIPTDKQGYLINDEVVVSRMNDKGETIYTKYFKPGLNQRCGNAHDLFKTKDGNFLICGSCSNGDNNEVDNYLLKMDPDGNLIWLQDYIVEGLAFEAFNIFELSNGDIVCTGADEGRDLLIAQKSDALGNKIWIKTVTPQLLFDVYGPSAVMTNSEEIVFLQYSQWEDPKTGEYVLTPHFTRLTKNGNYLYEKRPIVGEVGYAMGNHIMYDKDDNFYIVGEIVTDTMTYNDNAMLAKFDANLNLLWYKEYGSSNTEWFEEGVIGDDNIIHMIGYNQRRPPDYNLQAIYVSEDLKTVGNKDHETKNEIDVLVYPNPATDQIHLFFFNDIKSSEIYWSLVSVSGIIISHAKLDSQKLTIDISQIPSGVYALKFSDPRISMKRIIKK